MRYWQRKDVLHIKRKMTKYKNKYRIESNRLKGWDYGSNALYFITICCKNRQCFFGDVNDGKIKLSPIGHIANSCWVEIPNHFPFVVLHNHIIMPNHVHGIVEIAKSDNAMVAETPKLGVSATSPNLGVSMTASQKWKPNTLGTIINQYKRACTINARKINPDFAWQSNYHDRIIRDEKSYRNISNYIMQNPLKWNDNTFNPVNPNLDK